ncbi:MAG TPA: type I-E CRISPR-associated endonuclease Cas1e [Thermoanaerobaculales bacterium]|nr:type I-E CRISPR-associated endonuclease Cas1e [Thermoanaerobaculales bacterium]
MKERLSFVFVEKGRVDVLDGAFVVVDEVHGVQTHVPVGTVATIMLEPGSRISHAAAALAARVGCLLLWVGEGGVRLYAAGQPGGARSDKLLYQARLALDDTLRLRVVRRMYEVRFGGPAPARRSIEQLRGIEGARVRKMYHHLAQRHGLKWNARRYDTEEWSSADLLNRCLSVATACLYGVTEAAVLAAGYAPAIGFIHWGKPLSFVYDIADLFKFETVVPEAFAAAKTGSDEPEREVRYRCRDTFREVNLLGRIIPAIEEVLAAGEIEPPQRPADTLAPAIVGGKGLGDAGHRG